MSRSFKKHLVHGIACATSERFYKRLRSRQERLRAKEAFARGELERLERQIVPWDEWVTCRDGKTMYTFRESIARFTTKMWYQLFGK